MATKKQDKFARKMMLSSIAIREQLMSYFKDIDSSPTIRIDHGIFWQDDNGSTRYLYERRYRDMERRRRLYVGDVQFAEAGRNPNVFRFLPAASRSPQLRQLRDDATSVINRFLPTVEIIVDSYGGNEVDDTGMLDEHVDVRIRTGSTQQFYYDEYNSGWVIPSAGINEAGTLQTGPSDGVDHPRPITQFYNPARNRDFPF